MTDLIDEILQDWKTQRPDIDCSGKAVVCRILRFHSHYIHTLENALKPFGIKPNVYSVLVTIRRKGVQTEIPVKKISEEVLVTSGAMSNLLNRLVEQDLISKRQSEKDARSVFISLTSKGCALIDKVMEVQAACERQLTAKLNLEEKNQLANLLRKIQPEEFSYVSFSE